MDFKSIFDDDVRNAIDNGTMQVNHALAFMVIRRLNELIPNSKQPPTVAVDQSPKLAPKAFVETRKRHNKGNR